MLGRRLRRYCRTALYSGLPAPPSGRVREIEVVACGSRPHTIYPLLVI
jgi:hypothetical protein